MCTPDQDRLTRGPAEATISLTINGKACKAFENETILHFAQRHDICELDDIDHTPGTSRVCVVEIQQEGHDSPQILTSCNSPVRGRMTLQTRSKRHATCSGSRSSS